MKLLERTGSDLGKPLERDEARPGSTLGSKLERTGSGLGVVQGKLIEHTDWVRQTWGNFRIGVRPGSTREATRTLLSDMGKPLEHWGQTWVEIT